MPFTTRSCARCASENHPANRFCDRCGLPLGSVEPDAEAAVDALGPYESPDPADPDFSREVKVFVDRAGLEATPAGVGWRLVVPLRRDRSQAVYVGPAGVDPLGRPIVSVVSVCGPATHRDVGALMKFNGLATEAHFAIKMLRGEEYFVVVGNFPVDALAGLDARVLIPRIAELADGLEERLTRGRDLY